MHCQRPSAGQSATPVRSGMLNASTEPLKRACDPGNRRDRSKVAASSSCRITSSTLPGTLTSTRSCSGAAPRSASESLSRARSASATVSAVGDVGTRSARRRNDTASPGATRFRSMRRHSLSGSRMMRAVPSIPRIRSNSIDSRSAARETRSLDGCRRPQTSRMPTATTAAPSATKTQFTMLFRSEPRVPWPRSRVPSQRPGLHPRRRSAAGQLQGASCARGRP